MFWLYGNTTFPNKIPTIKKLPKKKIHLLERKFIHMSNKHMFFLLGPLIDVHHFLVAGPREARNPNLDSDQRIASYVCAPTQRSNAKIKITSWEDLRMSITKCPGHMRSLKLNFSATVLTLGLKVKIFENLRLC